MPRLLVVEDNEMNISLMSTFLKQMGYDVVMAKNGEEALVQAMNAEPDIILMDLMMPDMDGWEAAERLRAEDTTRDIPVIAVSAFIDDHYKETKKLFDDFCYKPIIFEDLQKKIDAALENRNPPTGV